MAEGEGVAGGGEGGGGEEEGGEAELNAEAQRGRSPSRR